MTYLIDKNTAYYGSGSKLIDLMDAFNPGEGTLRSLLLVSAVLMAPEIDEYTFHEGVTCAVQEDGTAFLFDNELDVVVDHMFSSVPGAVLQEFNNSVWRDDVLDQPFSGVVGSCRFFIMDDVTGMVSYHVADAFPDYMTGTYDQLNPPMFQMQ